MACTPNPNGTPLLGPCCHEPPGVAQVIFTCERFGYPPFTGIDPDNVTLYSRVDFNAQYFAVSFNGQPACFAGWDIGGQSQDPITGAKTFEVPDQRLIGVCCIQDNLPVEFRRTNEDTLLPSLFVRRCFVEKIQTGEKFLAAVVTRTLSGPISYPPDFGYDQFLATPFPAINQPAVHATCSPVPPAPVYSGGLGFSHLGQTSHSYEDPYALRWAYIKSRLTLNHGLCLVETTNRGTQLSCTKLLDAAANSLGVILVPRRPTTWHDEAATPGREFNIDAFQIDPSVGSPPPCCL
jgi:hypothetical protein